MRGALSARSGVAAAIALGGLAWALLLAAPGRGSLPMSCTYVEAGAPGPPDNVLRIDDGTDSVVHVYRDGDEIVVFNNLSRDPTSCAGGTPTVFNVDRIELSTAHSAPFVNYLGDGALAPGATPEPSGSEIELSIHEDYRPEVLNVAGTAAPETIVAGQLGQRQVGVNLNSEADGAAQDADVVLDTADPARVETKVLGKGGSDTLSALGGQGFTGPFPADRLVLFGGPGDNRLIGGPHDDRLSGGNENDVLLGGQGDDHIRVGPGSDLAKAGKGRDLIENPSGVGGVPDDTAPDRVYGGPGDDEIVVEQTLRGDLVRCGSGRRDRAIVDAGDRTEGCERVDVSQR